MVSNKQEALDLCKVYGVDSSVHPNIVVTSTGNIYTDGNIDPKDKGEKFVLNEVVEVEVSEVPEVEGKKPRKKTN